MNLRNLVTIHRPSLLAFTRDALAALPTNRSLRARVAELEAQREWLLAELAAANETVEDAWVSLVEALPDITPGPDAVLYTPPAERTIVHPSLIGPLVDRFATDLAGVETVGDLLWAMGGDE